MVVTNSLQLGKISMRNYKTYQGDVSVEMSLDPEKSITIIHGEMGKGKTTLLGAIYWCLYGEERTMTDSDEGILNSDVLRRLRVGDVVDTSAEMSLYEQGELRYKIKRSIGFEKKSESVKIIRHESVGGSLPSGIEITENIEYSELPPQSGDDWMVIHDPMRIQDRIENLFPKSLSSYFLFDAELLDKFYRADDETLVKNGIEKISGMPIIDNGIKHLEQSTKAIRKDIRDINMEPINNRISHWEKVIDDCKGRITDADSNLDVINSKIATIEFFLSNYNEKSIGTMQEEIDHIAANMKKIDGRRNENQLDMNNRLVSYNVILRLKGVMEYSIRQCNTWEKEGKIPIAVSRHVLNGMLHGKPPMCICGTPLDEGSTGRRHIEDLLGKNLADSPVINSISIGRGHWGDRVDETMQARDVLTRLMAKRFEINSEYDNQNDKIKELRKKLEMHDVDEIRCKSQKLKDLRAVKKEQDGIKAVANDGQERAERELKVEKQQYNDLLKRVEKYKSHKNRIKLAETLSGLLSNCRADLIEDMRNIVVKKTEEYFFKLVSREDFAKIEIRPDYKTAVLDRDGKSKALSAGQSCCLALSYIASIRAIAEKNYFMIIDSPLHNISQAERVDIARNLPRFIPGTQITLLVQDQEYVGRAKEGIFGDDIPSVRDTLKDNNNLWREYLLITSKNPDDISVNTTIKEAVEAQ